MSGLRNDSFDLVWPLALGGNEMKKVVEIE